MKSFTIAALAALWAQNAAAHATFQQLWVDGVDYGSQCARLPGSNSPVTDVSSTNMRCNAGSSPARAKCPVKAGGTVTVEMHQVRKPRITTDTVNQPGLTNFPAKRRPLLR
jgi:cellulase